MRRVLLRLALAVALLCLLPAASLGEGITRALLIGYDSFVSRDGMTPAAQNNVYALQTVLKMADNLPVVTAVTGGDVPTDPQELKELMENTFQDASPEDFLLIYLCTHGICQGNQKGLLLSNGEKETILTPQVLAELLSALPGKKLLILDACHSGLFIGRGNQEDGIPFGSDVTVLTSGGAQEDSWYWTDASGSTQGAFYFTQQLCNGISPLCGSPADADSNGTITLMEAFQYLLENHGTSTPQLYPADSDFPLITLGTAEGRESALRDITFSTDAVVPGNNASLTVEFTAVRPVCVAYQLIRQTDSGAWDYSNAETLYDGAERYAALGEMAGAVTAGRKSRVIHLDGTAPGYVLLQLISLDNGTITVHASHVIAILGQEEEVQLRLKTEDQEYRLQVFHTVPCVMTASLVDDKTNETLTRLCIRVASRPGLPGGSELYFSKTRLAPWAGQTCRIKLQVSFSDSSVTVLSTPFIPEALPEAIQGGNS